MQKTKVHLFFAVNEPKQYKEKEQENYIDGVKASLVVILLPTGNLVSKY